MQHEKKYIVIITEQKIPIIIIHKKKGAPINPYIVYDGRKHATFYRTPDEVILLDYLNPNVRQVLLQAGYAVIFEAASDGKDVIRDYKADIQIVEKNPLADGVR